MSEYLFYYETGQKGTKPKGEVRCRDRGRIRGRGRPSNFAMAKVLTVPKAPTLISTWEQKA